MFPLFKKSIFCYKYICSEPFRILLTCKRCLICAYFSPDSDKMTFTLEKAILWKGDFSWKQRFQVKNFLMMNLFHKWITCGLLWCFYQLFGLSFWRHPFTAEDQLVSKWCNTKFMFWWRNKLIYILERESRLFFQYYLSSLMWAWFHQQKRLCFFFFHALMNHAQ